jgi:hypothetical protein
VKIKSERVLKLLGRGTFLKEERERHEDNLMESKEIWEFEQKIAIKR